MTNFCTIYSHELRFDDILLLAKRHFPKASIQVNKDADRQIIQIAIKGVLFKSDKNITISYRERAQPSYQITNIDSPLTQNLQGMLGFVTSLPSKNENVKSLLVKKIGSLNSETAILHDGKMNNELIAFSSELGSMLDAVLFVSPDSPLATSQTQHFLDRDLNLLLDTNGNCEVDDLDVKIKSNYYDAPQENLAPDQTARKSKSEAFLQSKNIKVNTHLPALESNDKVNTRNPKEIAIRLTVLAITNYVAFNSISGDQGLNFLKKFELMDVATPKEKALLTNPTDELKSVETWKCEGIWTLLWALQLTDDLPFPNQLCDLKTIPPESYPIYQTRNPNEYIDDFSTIRSKEEILDAADLYYRMYWACVDARIKGEEMTAVNPGVVYERLYALNWLISKLDQEWDEVTCDT